MSKFILVFIFFLNAFIVTSEVNYKIIEDKNVYDMALVKIVGQVKKDEKYKISGLNSDNILKIENEYGIAVGIVLKNNEKAYINSKYLISDSSASDIESSIWIPVYYVEAYNKKNKDIIYLNQVKDKAETSRKFFWATFNPTTVYLSNSVLNYRIFDLIYNCLIEDIRRSNENKYVIRGKDLFRNKNVEIKIEINNDILKINIDWEFIEKEYRKVDSVFLDNFLKFINDSGLIEKKYIPTIPNLRFRETSGAEGQFIRMLVKGEKLELLERGKQEIINGVTGNWVKVRTEKGEEGWAFDAYLEEVKD